MKSTTSQCECQMTETDSTKGYDMTNRLLGCVGATIFAMVSTAFAEPPKPKFQMGKDTTFITEPLDADGYLDFETALNERLRGKITPETNAMVVFCQAFGPKPEGAEMQPEFYKWLGIMPPPAKGDYFVSLEEFLRKKTGKPLDTNEFDALMVLRKQPWTREEHTLVAEWLDTIDKPLARIGQGVERKDYFYPLISNRKVVGRRGLLLGALMPHVQKNRSIANALLMRAMLRMGERKFDLAWQDLIVCQRLGRHAAHGGTHLETLAGNAVVAVAIQSQLAFLERLKPDSKQAVAYIRELQSLPSMPTLVEKMELGERFVLLDCTQSIRRDGSDEGNDFGDIPKIPGPEREAALDLLDWNATFRTVFENYDRAIEIAQEPDRKKRKVAWSKLSTQLDEDVQIVSRKIKKQQNLRHDISERIGLLLSALLMPTVDRIGNSHDRIEQSHQNLQLAFALAAYRADNGKYPATLDLLAPKYLAKIPGDLFNDKPLIYQPNATGYILCSVGENGKDDIGMSTGDDITVRMPNP